jgi:hypothetical protein
MLLFSRVLAGAGVAVVVMLAGASPAAATSTSTSCSASQTYNQNVWVPVGPPPRNIIGCYMSTLTCPATASSCDLTDDVSVQADGVDAHGWDRIARCTVPAGQSSCSDTQTQANAVPGGGTVNESYPTCMASAEAAAFLNVSCTLTLRWSP